ncbi:DNA ligase [Erysiphe necator]|uniref:DNA ligase n=1 Tax=Uncinula necator TaxID=52586 RepID=A0A0B1P9M5_UNCNE|nr:DNA ligase [Erysiphe necator]KHJ35382.1 putative dna ligase i [Erysiphe necator]
MPGKRRKLNSEPLRANREISYFFAKQQDNLSGKGSSVTSDDNTKLNITVEQTDEELARKLQFQWNQQDAELKFTKQENNFGKASESPTLKSNYPLNFETSQLMKISKCVNETKENESSCTISLEAKTDKILCLQSSGLSGDSITSSIPFDENPLKFTPLKYWKEHEKKFFPDDGKASYALLTRCFVLINSTSSRIKIVDTLTNFLRLLIEGEPSSLLPSVWLATNSISPPFIPLELGLGGSFISKALKNIYNIDAKALKALYNKVGDAGDVAFEVKKRQTYTLRRPKPLTIKGVYQSLVKIANTRGNGSVEIKQRIVDRLLQDAQGPEESRFLVRTLCQHLRIGAVKTTMLIALSRAFQLSRSPGAEYPLKTIEELSSLSKEAITDIWSRGEETVKACYARRPNYDDLVPTLLEIGVCNEILIQCGLALHIPLCPMLGSITRDLSEMLSKFQDRQFTCEYKYDGQRAQIHCDDQGKISIFSRHLEIMTDKYPDLVALIAKIRGENVKNFIMEGEVVAVDHSTGEFKSFQTLSNRARKEVAIGSIKVEVCFFAFDLMYFNDEPLLQKSLRQRRKLLREQFTEIKNRFTWVKSLDATSHDSETILEFFNSAIQSKCEGIMVKMLDHSVDSFNYDDPDLLISSSKIPIVIEPSKTRTGVAQQEKRGRCKVLLSTYEPDKRLESWLKIKKDYTTCCDTLDLIPIAAWHGQGRKSKWWSPILLAVKNEITGSLEAVCKCISGFTDTFYKENKEFYREDGPNVLSRKPGFVEYDGGHPDVWFEPQEVFEMAFADLTLSPVYTAAIGLVSEERGLSMRFPRYVKKRTDKTIDEASTSEFLAELWRKQEARSLSTIDTKNSINDED